MLAALLSLSIMVLMKEQKEQGTYSAQFVKSIRTLVNLVSNGELLVGNLTNISSAVIFGLDIEDSTRYNFN